MRRLAMPWIWERCTELVDIVEGDGFEGNDLVAGRKGRDLDFCFRDVDS